MPPYNHEITIPANTSQSSPHEETMPIQAGLLKRVFVGFPPGCLGRAHLGIYYQGHRIIPEGIGPDFKWDGYTYLFEPRIEITSEPYHLILKGWNEDMTYSHTVHVAAEVDPIPLQTTESLLERLIRVFVGE